MTNYEHLMANMTPATLADMINGTPCQYCYVHNHAAYCSHASCHNGVKDYLLSEYVPPAPTWEFTDDEKSFLGMLHDGYNYLARDNNGKLWAYWKEPVRKDGYWQCADGDECAISITPLTRLPFDGVKSSDTLPCDFRRFL